MSAARWCAAALLLLCAPAAHAGDDLSALGVRVERLAGPVLTLPIEMPPAARPADALPDGQPGLGRRDIAAAWLTGPTGRYGHGVLGDAVEAGGLRAVMADGRVLAYRLAPDSVFEDLQPRLADLDGDGRDEILVVRAYLSAGAALAVFSVRGGELVLRAETAPIGIPNRWLNPIGVGDFDGDGAPEAAYVETPHIGGILRVVALRGGRLVEEATAHGVSNHAMGSRALGLSAVLDLDGNGSDDIVLPTAGRGDVRLISLAGGTARDLAVIRHGAAITTDFAVHDRDGNGRPDIAYGLADGTHIVLWR